MSMSAISGGISGILGALGGAGKQQSQTTTPTQPSWLTGFQQGLIPQFQNAMFKAQQPVYGPGQEASYIQGQQRNTQQAGNTMLSQLARSGALNSGRAEQGLTGLQNNLQSNIANFQSQVPFLNKQMENQQTNEVMGQMANWAGRPPSSTTTTANGPSFTSGLLSNLGGLGMQGAQGNGPFGKLLNPSQYNQNQTLQTLLGQLMGNTSNGGH